MSGLTKQQRAELDAGIEKWIDRGDELLKCLAPVVARMLDAAEQQHVAKVRVTHEEVARAHEKARAHSSRTVDWQSFDAGYRAALASEGTDALAKVRADVLRDAVEQDAITIPDVLGYKVAAVAVEDLLDRADRIEAGDVQ